MKPNYFLVLTSIALLGCNTQSNKEKVEQPVTKRSKSHKNKGVKSGVIRFSISDCRDECRGDSGKVWSNELIGDTLSLRLGHWFNCAWQQGSLSNVLLRNDTLNLMLTRPHEDIEIDEEGNEVKIYASMECNCYFFLDLQVRGVQTTPKVFLVNGRALENYWGEVPD
jgi:hypothetical protein